MATLIVPGRGARKLRPLSAALSFVIDGGGATQAVNAVTGEHIPDWRFTPIRIRPIITVTDPEGLVTNGVHNSDISVANMRWLYDETGVNVLVGVSQADMSVDTSATDLRGSLNIRKNFEAGALLRFEFEYSTSASGVLRTVKHSGTIAIVVNQMADALVQVRTVYPRGQFVFFPQPAAPANPRMQMQLYYKGEACPAAYKWFKVTGGNETATGAFANELSVPAAGVSAQPNYRCKALDMRPEYAAALEAALGRARADVYKKYLGDDWETVLPTCSDNILPPNFYFARRGGGGLFIDDLGQDPEREEGYHTYRYYGVTADAYYFYRFFEGQLPLLSGRTVVFSFLARNRRAGAVRMYAHLYLKKTTSWHGLVRGDGPNINVSGEFIRVSVSFKVPPLTFDDDKALLLAPMFKDAGQVDVEIKDISYQIDGSEFFLPSPASLQSEIRARAAEIVATNPPTPPAVWPLERTYIRDFTLSTQTIPYELLLRIEGLGEVVIVRNGSLARGAGPAQELFSNVSRDMIKFRASIVCRQGRHTYTPEQTAAMFDVTWPAGSESVNGCKAVMTSLDFNLSITPKYL